MNFFDRNPLALEKGHNTALEDIQCIHRIFRGIDLCKYDAGITVHDRFDINTACPGNIANILDRAEEKRFLEERVSVIESRIFFLLCFMERALDCRARVPRVTRFFW